MIALTGTAVSGSLFPVGTTDVTYTARDGAGLEAKCTFSVTVVDREKPSLFCPPDVSVTTTASSQAVTWASVVVVDNVDGSLAASLSTASGSNFAVGTTTPVSS